MASHAKWKAYTASVAVFSSAFLIAFIASSIFTPMKDTNADTNTTDQSSADGYSLTLATTSAVDLGLTVGPVDVMSVVAGTVNVKTTSPGYKLFIGMTGSSANLNGVGGVSGSIAATTGTLAAPAALARGTWGYAVPSGTAHLVSNGFSSTYTEMSSAMPDTTMRFAIPPTASNNPDLLAASTAATASAGDTYPVYYGVRANMTTAQGNYTNNVMFTAVADAGATEAMTLTPAWTTINTATTVNVATALYSTDTSAALDIYLLTDAQMTSVNGGTAVENLGVSALTCSRTSGAPVTYSCTVPSTATAATYHIYAKSAKYDKAYSEQFDIIKGFFDISNMQEMTARVCESATTPAKTATNKANIDTDGSKKGNTAYVPQRELTDTRNSETYIVRKLADGNCWMTENLRLELTANQVLSPSTSDVTVDTKVGMTTQPYNQASTNRYNWGVADTSSTDYNRNSVDRWLSRSTKVSGEWTRETNPVQSVSADRKQDLTGENQRTGVFYNWFTATAGTGNWDISTSGVTATSSICPKGWQLPRHSAVNGTSTLAPNGSWMHLIRDAYGVIGISQGDQGDGGVAPNKTHAFPLSLPFFGNVGWRSGSIEAQGLLGAWWSADSTSQNHAHNLYIYSAAGVWPENGDNRLYGFAVRCVARRSS